MSIYILYLLLVFIFSMHSSTYRKNRKITLILFIFLFLIMALRDSSVGSDISHYLDIYESQVFFDDIWTQFEFGYFAFSKLCFSLGFSSQLFLAIISFFICVAVYSFITKYSFNPIFSLFLYITIGLFAFSLTGLRQIIAICILLYSISFVVNRKPVAFILLVLVAATFHKSSMFFLLTYPFSFFRIDTFRKFSVIIITSLVIILFRRELSYIVSFLSADKYTGTYGAINDNHKLNPLLHIINYLLFLFVPFISLISKRKLNSFSSEMYILVTLSSIPVLLTGFVMNSAMIERISYYFSSSYIILIPNAIEAMTISSNKVLIYSIISIVCFLFFYIGNTDGILQIDSYKFFFTIK